MSAAVRRSPTTRPIGSQPSRQRAARSSGSSSRRAGPAEEQMTDRAAVARRSEASRDLESLARARIKRLAAECGVEAGPLLEELRERTWAMTCAEVPDPERRAAEHIEERFR